MTLPRNARARGDNTRIKQKKSRIIHGSISKFDSMCNKHKLGKLTFKECLFSNESGDVTYIEHTEVIGNMRLGACIIKVSSMTPSSLRKYELVEIANAKHQRELLKQQKDNEKTLAEMKRIAKSENIPLDTLSESTDTLPESTDTLPESTDAVPESTDALPESTNAVSESTDATIPSVNLQSTSQLPTIGNKYFRNFIHDLKSSFSVISYSEFKYFDATVETVHMVIVNCRVFEIEMPEYIQEKYLLVLGDLQLKSAAIREIDSTYQSENVINEQYEMLSRIQEKEGTKIIDTEPEDLESSDEESCNAELSNEGDTK